MTSDRHMHFKSKFKYSQTDNKIVEAIVLYDLNHCTKLKSIPQ